MEERRRKEQVCRKIKKRLYVSALRNDNKEQEEHEGLGLRGAFGGGMGPVQFNDEYEDINAYRER